MPEPILIIGAGIGGLTAALALLQRGLPVEVYEDAPELGDVGAGISVQANMRNVIAGLGLIDALADEAVTANAAAQRHYQTGEILDWIDHTGGNWQHGDGAHLFFLHRADLHGALAAAIQAIDAGCIRLNKHLVTVTQDGDSATAHFADGSTARGQLLVGADGLRSVTRATLFGEESPRYSGVVAWRGLVPADRLPPGLFTPDSCRWIGPDWRILCYPVRHRTLINYVASVANQTWQVESWKEHSTVEELLGLFAGCDPVIAQVISQTPPELCYKWALFDRDLVPKWGVGRVILLGDAAHPTLPFLGQGAGMAMEDGIVLARCLAHDSDLATALDRYVRLRKPRTDRVQTASRALAQWPFMQAARPGSQTEPARERAMATAYNAATAPLDE